MKSSDLLPNVLPDRLSAKATFSTWQIWFVIILAGSCAFGFYFMREGATSSLLSICTLFTSVVYIYGVFLIIVAIVVDKRARADSPKTESVPNHDDEFPLYTILLPLYREASLIPQIVSSLLDIQYPINKLDIIFLLETDDQETIDAINAHVLPPHFRSLIVPPGHPQSKPRACNVGLAYARGEYVVIYDAEDQPEPDQLMWVLDAFRSADTSVFCVQCRLNCYNARQNILTRLFTMEYSLWFDRLLIGLGILKLPIPLGGTSNHFRTMALKSLGGWDAYNMTEDCDLGMRLALAGYQTVIIDSTTWEEANSQLYNWIRQRSRWVKGYLQTYLVHMRDPVALLRKFGLKKFISFQIVVGGTPFVLLCAPLFWLATGIIFLHKLGPIASGQVTVDTVVVGWSILSYAAVLLFGICGAMVRRNYDLIKYAFLLPIYYSLQSYAAWKGLVQLFVRPHYWEKTTHGLN